MSRLGEIARAPLTRLLMLTGLVLLLQVPSCMIGQLTWERRQSRDAATTEVSGTWGVSQHVAGPFLAVPYRVEGLDKKGVKYTIDSGTVVLLPDTLDVHAQAAVETLHRGLFDVPVYRTELRMSGRFAAPLAEFGALVPRESLLWNEAQLVLRVADVHGIERVRTLNLDGVAREFRGGTGLLSGSGLNAPLAGLRTATPADFTIDIDLRGSSGLFFAPTAKETAVALRSAWPHPKFTGAWLPDFREVTAQGFTASWKLTSLAGGFPTASKRGPSDEALASALFGAELLNPVDPYRMSERTLKYDLLFIGLTFVVVWLFEQLAGRAVHAVQYLMLGASLCLFYLLVLSLAEHVGFATAYAAAAGAVTLQVSFYARSVLRGWGPAAVLMALVGSLYALLYLLLQVEDYALLTGAATLFVLLSAVMFLTRRIRWDRSASAEPSAAQ